MMRLTEGGVAVCAAIHDGFLVECDVGDADAVLKTVTATMDKCAVDLISAPIPIKSKIFRWPERYHEGKTGVGGDVRDGDEAGRRGGRAGQFPSISGRIGVLAFTPLFGGVPPPQTVGTRYVLYVFFRILSLSLPPPQRQFRGT